MIAHEGGGGTEYGSLDSRRGSTSSVTAGKYAETASSRKRVSRFARERKERETRGHLVRSMVVSRRRNDNVSPTFS